MGEHWRGDRPAARQPERAGGTAHVDEVADKKSWGLSQPTGTRSTDHDSDMEAFTAFILRSLSAERPDLSKVDSSQEAGRNFS